MTKAANTDVSGFTSDRSLRRTCLGLFVNASPQNKRLFNSRETNFVVSFSHREDFVTRQRPHTFCMHLPPIPQCAEGTSPLVGLAAGPAASMQPGGLLGCSLLPPQAAACSAIPQILAFPLSWGLQSPPKNAGLHEQSPSVEPKTLLAPLEGHSPLPTAKRKKTGHTVLHLPFSSSLPLLFQNNNYIQCGGEKERSSVHHMSNSTAGKSQALRHTHPFPDLKRQQHRPLSVRIKAYVFRNVSIYSNYNTKLASYKQLPLFTNFSSLVTSAHCGYTNTASISWHVSQPQYGEWLL